jgi:D-3-phosphoglycerate dehydrogenase / 2-oxoglutarate reductase
MNIAILDDYHDTVRTLQSYAKLAGHKVTIWNDHTKDVAVLAERLKDTEALVLFRERTPITAALVERLPKLKLISQKGSYPHIDVEACTRHGVMVCSRRPGPGGEPSWATAELTWALVLMGLRDLPRQIDSMKAGRWQFGVGHAAHGRILGIYAYGRIGSLVAQVGKAFGMRVWCWGREGSTTKAKAAGYEVAPNREAFFAESDVISLHLPLSDGTRGIVTAEDLARMKTTALIVNTSRAPIIAKDALVNALKAGRPGRAAIDVYEDEPVMNAAHPLIGMDNVVCTPHLGYVEERTYEAYYGTAVEQIMAYISGQPINVANPEVLNK